MSTYEEGDQTARGWKGKKYYLSDEAIALLVAHCKGTPLTMSAYLDQLIKAQLTPAGVASLSPRDRGIEEANRVLSEGKRQLEELTTTDTRAGYEKAGGFDGVVKRSEQIPGETEAPAETVAKRHPMDFADEPTRRAREAALREEFDKIKKQPTKKDFDLDV